MENEQTPNTTEAPPSAGQPDVNAEVAKLREDNTRLEREKQGIFSDLKSERERRQALERSQSTTASTNGGTVLPAQGSESEVARIVKPLYDEVVSLRGQNAQESALLWFAKKEKQDVESPKDVVSTPAFKELQQVITKFGLEDMPVERGIKTAYELMLREREKSQKAKDAEEASRNAVVAGQASASGVGIPAPSSRTVKVSRQDIGKMSPQEYSAMKDKAAKSGETIQVD